MTDELEEIAKLVVEAFRDQKATFATAESCTGGLVSALLTSVAGSSDVFGFGFVTYSNQAKSDLLGVDPAIIETHGAVSAQCALAMAEGARNRAGADAAVAITGIAGPGGGSEEKPVGTVYIAVSAGGETGSYVEKFEFGDPGRQEVRQKSAAEALEMLMAYGLEEATMQ